MRQSDQKHSKTTFSPECSTNENKRYMRLAKEEGSVIIWKGSDRRSAANMTVN